MRTKKKFDIERVREFCKLINEGNTPNRALIIMRSSNGYITPLKKAGIYWKEKDGTFRAVERVRVERYELFKKEKMNYNRLINETPKVEQKNLFSEPKPKTGKISSSKNIVFSGQTMTLSPAPAPTMKAKEKQLNFIQRAVKSLFKL